MACITYPPAAFTLPHTSQLKYSVTVNVCLDCVDHERCQSRLKVLENDTCIHSIIGHSGLRKLGLDAAGQLVQGDCLRALLRHDDWLRGLSTLVLVDYGYSGEIELTKVHFRDVRMMEARGPKLKLCPLRISQDPHPVLQERLNAERQANNERILEEQRRRTLETIAREQEQEEEARNADQQNNCA